MSEENKTLIYAELLSGTVGGYVTDYSQIKNAPDPKVNTINELTGLILPNPNDSNISHAVAKAYDSLNNSIFIESHAKATYMSDGSTVEDAIKNIENNNSNIDLSDYETKEDALARLQEAKDYTDSKISELQEDVVMQTIELTKGWNWVSFYVETSLEKLQNALGTNGIEIKYMDFTTSYDEESGLWLSAGNPLTSIEPSKMYMINTNSNCVIELEGKLLEDVEITLNQGENNISYPLNQEVDINTALQNLNATQGDNIKGYGTTSIATYYNGKWVGPLETLSPGQGYMYTSNSAETITFKYPNSLDIKLSDYTTKEYVDEEINLVNTKIDSLHNKTAIQTIELTEGWNSVSFYVDITLEQLQEALGNNALLIKDEVSRKFILYSQTSGWYGTLKELVAGRYYGINIASSCKILLTGTLLDPNEITYVIGTGYTYIGYPLNHKLDINIAFKSIEPQEGDRLSKYINGETLIISLYSEGVWNGVQQLVPGQGYTYYSTANTNKPFTYPSVEIDFLSFVTEDDLKSKLQEAKDYTDTKTDELRDVVTQTLSLRAGYKWYSFYVDITLEQLQRAFGTNVTSITTSFDGTTEVTSSYDANTNTWSGDLTTLDVTKMYIINVNTDCEISLTGRKIPNSTSYTLNPGWNWISYPFNEPMDISDALANVEAAEGDAIKDKSGDLYTEYYQEYGWLVLSTTPGFIPGQGYKYYNASTEPNTLVFTTELIDTKLELTKKQNTLVSGTNIKTVNGQSLLGNGDLEIQGLKTYTFDYNNYNTLTQEEFNKILEADKIYIKHDDILVEITVKLESDIFLNLSGYANSINYVNEYHVSIRKRDLELVINYDSTTLITDSDLEDYATQIYYNEPVTCSYIEDGLVLEEQYLNIGDTSKIIILPIYIEELNKIFLLYSNVLSPYSLGIDFYGKYTDTSLLKATYNINDSTLTFNIIEQSGGSSSSGGAYALVEHGTNDTTYTLTPNTFHVWGEVNSLTLTLGEEQSGVANEFLFQFESGETATTLTLPDDLIWANDDTPVIESNYTYQVSILKGFATLMKFKKVVLLEFTITVYEGYGMNTRHETYSYKTGMTWGQWVNSEYNTNGDYKITNGYIYNDVANVMSGTVYYATSLGPVEITESDIIDNTIKYCIE